MGDAMTRKLIAFALSFALTLCGIATAQNQQSWGSMALMRAGIGGGGSQYYIYAVGGTNGLVRRFAASDLTLTATSTNFYPNGIISICADDQFVYYGGGNSNIIKCSLPDMQVVATSASVGYSIRVLRTDGISLYPADASGGSPRIKKYRCSDLSFVTNSAVLGAVGSRMYGLQIMDGGTNIAVALDTTNVVKRYNTTTMDFVDQTIKVTSWPNSLGYDGSNLYVHGNAYSYGFRAADMSLIYSNSYGAANQAVYKTIPTLGSKFYTTHNGPAVRKYDSATGTNEAISAAYGTAIGAIGAYGTFVYAASGAASQPPIRKYNASSMALITNAAGTEPFGISDMVIVGK
jgi:hypothetical protein